MAQTDLVCSKCVGRRTVNNIMIKVNSKVMVTTVPPDQPLAYTRRPIFVSSSVHILQVTTLLGLRLRNEITVTIYTDTHTAEAFEILFLLYGESICLFSVSWRCIKFGVTRDYNHVSMFVWTYWNIQTWRQCECYSDYFKFTDLKINWS
jgi:hypothetical protein